MADNGELIVSPKAIGKYSMDMQQYAMTARNAAGTKVAAVGPDSGTAFGGMGVVDGHNAMAAGQFAEGAILQAAMEKQTFAFNAFLNDMTRGISAIGNAAAVCAFTYNATDVEAAEKMNMLEYAFATDPDAKAPPGLPKEVTGETLLDREMKNQGGAGQPDAVANPESGNNVPIFNGGTLTTYADGSSRTVITSADPNRPGGVVTVTTITGKGGVVLSTQTTKTVYLAGGVASEYYHQEKTPPATIKDSAGKAQKTQERTSTTETTVNADGSRTVTTTTTEGKDKKVDVVEVAPAKTETSGGTTTEMPLKDVNDELGVKGGRIKWTDGYPSLASG